MSDLRQRIISSKDTKTHFQAAEDSSPKINNMEVERNSNAAHVVDDTDSLTPLMDVSDSCNKNQSIKSIGSEPTVATRQPNSKLGLFSFIGMAIVLFQICCEVMKQLSNYSLQYYNKGRFPIPQTIIVIVVALMKLFVTVLRARGKCPISNQGLSWSTFRSSFRFLVPAILYGINNNIYFFGLTLVAPPIWLILTSFRTIITASMYKFFLKRPISRGQFLGCLVIVISLVVAKLPDILQIVHTKKDSTVINIVADIGIDNSTDANTSESTIHIKDSINAETPLINAVPIAAIILAMAASCNSVGAALYTEHLFKSNTVKNETFLDQQFWMYFYESLVAILLHSITLPTYNIMSLTGDLLGMEPRLQGVLCLAIMCGSIGGIVVASILKLLDNIVKEYSGSTANILTALLCSVLFPDKFELTNYIVLSMACLFTGIYLYESRKVTTNVRTVSSNPKHPPTEVKL